MFSSLKEAREAAGYSLEEIASKLNIRKQYLIALEEENYDVLPGKIYVEGYTKMYYELLGINLSSLNRKEPILSYIVNNNDEGSFEKKFKKYIIFFSIVLLIIVTFFYNFLKLQTQESYLIKSDALDDRNYEESFDGSYKKDK